MCEYLDIASFMVVIALNSLSYALFMFSVNNIYPFKLNVTSAPFHIISFIR
jgi:hypothetical protein